jgi:hypothetical protein
VVSRTVRVYDDWAGILAHAPTARLARRARGASVAADLPWLSAILALPFHLVASQAGTALPCAARVVGNRLATVTVDALRVAALREGVFVARHTVGNAAHAASAVSGAAAGVAAVALVTTAHATVKAAGSGFALGGRRRAIRGGLGARFGAARGGEHGIVIKTGAVWGIIGGEFPGVTTVTGGAIPLTGGYKGIAFQVYVVSPHREYARVPYHER